MPDQTPTTFIHSISAALLGNTAQKLDLDARIDLALQGPRRFHIHEDFQPARTFAAALIGNYWNQPE